MPKKSKFPKSFAVGPHEVKVRLGKEIASKDEAGEEGGQCYGIFIQTDSGGEIWLDGNMSGQRLYATLFHELCHAIDETYGLSLEHRQIYGLGEGLAQALAKHLKF